ncbi:efflux RND transporter periplasmic adaptor subunit [Wenzhouxiangella sp. XN79A]|uniref:efflux RND transporter periplasmic adaptor subunit n=1 Tax=Wenzhouxiangella sp. XN79A TaxID=2724193 RepID=UPI00144A6F9C|nr:efflux RND transporter periplasmic adaptor subunit [Wenzhouxiangella sp. XN79A]NKI35585.1 efflux RND transporter periplasmic adaptor subunit [Wenzhouxiangella sp. XN79A]
MNGSLIAASRTPCARPSAWRSILSAVLLLVLLAGCSGEPESDGRSAGHGDGDGQASRTVRTVIIGPPAEEASVVAAGVVAPVRRARMGTRQAGNVEEVMVQAGQAVAEGQPILRVDARDLEAALQAARLQRQAARTAWETARRNRERFGRLYEERLIARARLEEVELVAEDARGRLEQAEAELAAVEVNLDYATLRAPFAGVVSEVLADVGTFVAPGPPLAVFEDRSRLEINVGIGQKRATGLAVDDVLPFRVDGLEDELTGRVDAVLPALEPPGVGQTLRLIVDAPPPALAPGMIAEVRLPVKDAAPSFVLVPASAVIRRGQLSGVFVIDESDQGQPRARLRWLAVAASPTDGEADDVRVLRGLGPGDRVIVGPAVGTLVDGQPVAPVRP